MVSSKEIRMHIDPAFSVGDLIINQKPVQPGMIVNIKEENNSYIYFIKFPCKKKLPYYIWDEDFIIRQLQEGTHKCVSKKHARS